MIVKPFLQLLLSFLLIILTCMMHYMSPSRNTSQSSILPYSAFLLLTGFAMLYYTVFGTSFSAQYVSGFVIAYLATLYHLYEYEENACSSSREASSSQLSLLWVALGWILLGMTLHSHPRERMYIVLAMLGLLVAWLKWIPWFRKRKISDHPGYIAVVLAWVFIAYRLTKIDLN